jgi:HEPN domain-containing protein
MKASTRDWIAKAEEDFAPAIALSRLRKKPLWSPVCFHAQQGAEKYLKARLNEASIQFYKTHDLEQLLNQVLTVEPLWAAFRPALKRLTDSAILPRYPGNFFTKFEVRFALKTCRAFRKEVRHSFGLPTK